MPGVLRVSITNTLWGESECMCAFYYYTKKCTLFSFFVRKGYIQCYFYFLYYFYTQPSAICDQLKLWNPADVYACVFVCGCHCAALFRRVLWHVVSCFVYSHWCTDQYSDIAAAAAAVWLNCVLLCLQAAFLLLSPSTYPHWFKRESKPLNCFDTWVFERCEPRFIKALGFVFFLDLFRAQSCIMDSTVMFACCRELWIIF